MGEHRRWAFVRNPWPVIVAGLAVVAVAVAAVISLSLAACGSHEAELAVVISRLCKSVPVDRAGEVVLGYTCANDVSARDWQRHGGGGQCCRGKTFDTFCPLGPAIETELDPLEGLRIECRVNGEVRQDGSTEDLVFPVAHLVWYVSRVMTLFPGDMISTGTPSGVGPLSPGDRVDVQIEGIGTLSNRVMRVKEEPS